MADNTPVNSLLAYFVVVNHNGSVLLRECLNALKNQIGGGFKILLVDNGSSDDSVALVEAEFPDVEIIALQKNLEYARAHNLAIERVLAENPRYIALVNNDAVLQPEWLSSMTAFLETGGFDLAQTLIVDYDRPEKIDSAGIGLSRHLRFFDRHHDRLVHSVERRPEIFGPCFAAAAVKSHVFRSLKQRTEFLDETFGAFYEDVDFCFRANLYGFKSGLLLKPQCRHRRSHTANRRPFRKYFLIGRNYFLVLAKHVPTSILIRNAHHIFLDRMVFGLRTLKQPRFLAGLAWGSLLGTNRLLVKRLFGAGADRVRPRSSGLIRKITEGFYE